MPSSSDEVTSRVDSTLVFLSMTFIVVVIGGLGSLWGTFLGAIIFGQVLAFGILILPGFSLFAVFVLMAFVLIVRPAGLLGRPVKR